MSFRRCFVGIAAAVVFQAAQTVAQYSVTMPYKLVTVQNVNGVASFSGAPLVAEAGKPALPLYTVAFLLPPDADLSSVTATIDNPSEQLLADQYTVAPWAQTPGVKSPASVVNGKDTSIYKKNAFYPADYKGSVQSGAVHQYKYVTIIVNPYKYNPVTKKLRMLSGGTLKVTYKTGSVITESGNSDAGTALSSKVVNPAVLGSYNTSSSQVLMENAVMTASLATAAASASSLSGALYLIITTDYISNNSQMLQTYVNNLNNSGAANVMISSDATWNSTGTTNNDEKADNLRSFIKFVYSFYLTSSTPLKYVLIIGNPDPTAGDVPMKVWGGIPTDHYYADMTADGAMDAGAEIAVGRIPVYGTNLTELDSYLNKVIAYENATDVEWRRSLLAMSEAFAFNFESHQACDSVVSILKPQGFSYKRMYHAYGINCGTSTFHLVPGIINMNPLPDYTEFTTDHVANVWNSEAPGLVCFAGHGAWFGTVNILQTTPYAFNNPENVSRISSKYPAIVFGESCSTEDPDSVNNCGARSLFNNAINYLGSTRDVKAAEQLAYEYFRLLKNNSTTGNSMVGAKNLLLDSDYSTYFNLLGCPEVSLNLATINPSLTPKNFKASVSPSVFGINLSWSAVTGATQYKIERSEVHTGSVKDGFTLIGSTGSGVVTYNDANMTSTGTCYKYRVYALNSSNVRGPYSQIDSATFFGARSPDLSCAVPANLTVSSVHSNIVNLSWAASANAASYNLKRSTSSSGPFVTISNGTATSYSDRNVLNKTTYYYTVSAVNQYGQSANSGIVSAKPVFDLAAPTITSVSDFYGDNGYAGVYVKWDPANRNAVSFLQEFGLKFPDGSYGEFKNVEKNNLRLCRDWYELLWEPGNSALPFNSEIVFRNTGFSNDSSTAPSIREYITNYGPIPRYNPITPTGFTVDTASEYFNLNWTYVLSGDPAAVPTGCEVYCNIDGYWYSYGTEYYPTHTASFTFPPNTKAKFCVRAVNASQSGVTYYSRFSPVVTATTPSSLLKPTGLTATVNSRGTVDLVWDNKSNNLSGNYIEQATSASGPFTQVATALYGTTSCTRTGLSDAKQYWFRVRTFYNSYTSAYSTTATATTLSNIAPGKSASSLTVQTANPVANGIDNKTTTRWCASSGSGTQWYQVDLGASKTISGTEEMWEKSGSGYVYKYKIQVSNSPTVWTSAPVADLSSNTSTAQTQAQNFTPVSGRYVRITITGVPTNCWASFYEFRIFAK